jgi:hypothetical protein
VAAGVIDRQDMPVPQKSPVKFLGADGACEAIGVRVAMMRNFVATAMVLALAVMSVGVVAVPCAAHVGSPDIYFQGAAGPYHLVVTVRTPQMIPGVATVEVVSATPGITKISAVPTFIVGPGAKYPPAGDALTQASGDPQFFSGKVWLMESGSWQVLLKVSGSQGDGELAVPVPAMARGMLGMQRGLGALLLALMALLVAAFIAIMGAARREGALDPGGTVPARNRRRARVVMGVAAVLVAAVLVGGNVWWDSEAAAKARNMIYEAPSLDAEIVPGSDGGAGARLLRLQMAQSLWHSRRPETVMTKLVPDHGHLMHLFLLREPGLDVFYHLHPKLVETPDGKQRDVSNTFDAVLPAGIPAGRYQVFADVVRESGFPDTMTAEIDVPAATASGAVHAAGGLNGDDSMATVAAGARAVEGPDGPVVTLADGYKMVWVRGSAPLVANQFVWLRFRLEDAGGKAVTDAEPYMGMAGHAEIVSEDRSVFAHIHPDGSAAMAAVEMANPRAASGAAKGGDAMAGIPGMSGMSMDVMTGGPSATVSFPYGFPKAGRYRIFAQMKRGGVVETGVFDAEVVAK